MSGLANSCEHLTNDKTCLAVSGSEKAKASRQARCRNEEKLTCCYLCMFVLNCATPCQFLGNTKSESEHFEEKNKVDSTPLNSEKPEKDHNEDTEGTYCSLCNVEMSQARTKFKIDQRKKTLKKFIHEDTEKPADEVLPVIVYLCPKCGKIELKADEKNRT